MSTMMKNTTGVIDAFKSIPPAAKRQKNYSTAIGVGIMAFGWFAKSQWPDLPTMVAFGTTAFGAVMVSGEYFRLPWKLFVAAIRDLVNAVKGQKSTEPEESNDV